jgi:Asp-tRNA(Asn)/Glu-tRNA(Gln) amidotransferase A subunit family amidase
MLISKTPLAETAETIRNGSINIIDYINELCDRIEANESQVQAFIPEENRRERLLKEAAELEERFPDPQDRPLLYGVPVGVKDIFRVDGFPTKAGSKLPPELFEGKEAESVTKLKEAGALIAGKTVTTEFAYFEPGPTRNPYNFDHTPGGSSSGSAAGVACGFFPLALGTQTIGSVIRPAAFCGIIGFKPSFDRIPTDGLIMFSPSADHVGLFTQDIEGMDLACSILCNWWKPVFFTSEESVPPASPLAPSRRGGRGYEEEFPILAIPDGKYLKQASEEGLTAFEEQLKKLQQAGYTIKRITMFEDIEDIETINQRHRQMIAAEFAQEHANWFGKYKDLYRPRTRELLLNGQQIDPRDHDRARKARQSLRKYIADRQVPANIDIWLSPPAKGAAPEGIHATGDPIMNLPWTNAGLPTITLPAGMSKENLPLGLQCTTAFLQDEKLIFWARDLMEVLRS